MSIIVHDGQAAIVTVKSSLDAIGRCKRRRNDFEVKRCKRYSASGQDIVGIALLNAGLSRREASCRSGIFVGHPLAAKIADAYMVMTSRCLACDDVDRRKVVVEPHIWADCPHLCPGKTS